MAFPYFTLVPDLANSTVVSNSFAALLARCDPSFSIGTGFGLTRECPAGMDPASFTEQSFSQYASQFSLGGHAAAKTFLRNANRIISFTIEFMAVGGGDDPRVRQVRAPVALLDSLLYPVYNINATVIFPPPLVVVSLSDMCSVRGVVQSCVTTWGGGWGPPVSRSENDVQGWLPDRATVAMTIMGVGFGGGGYSQGQYNPFQSVSRQHDPVPQVFRA